MTYRQLCYLKYKKGVSTYDLVRRFPSDLDLVSEIALLEIPEEILREVLREEDTLKRLMRLKRRFAKLLRVQSEGPAGPSTS